VKRSDKNNFVQKLKDELNSSSSVIVAHYAGLSVLETDKLRKEMRDNGAKFKVTKNRLTKLALADTPYESIADLFLAQLLLLIQAIQFCRLKLLLVLKKN